MKFVITLLFMSRVVMADEMPSYDLGGVVYEQDYDIVQLPVCHCDSPDRIYERGKNGKCYVRQCERSDTLGPRCRYDPESDIPYWGIWSAKPVDEKFCAKLKPKPDPTKANAK